MLRASPTLTRIGVLGSLDSLKKSNELAWTCSSPFNIICGISVLRSFTLVNFRADYKAVGDIFVALPLLVAAYFESRFFFLGPASL